MCFNFVATVLESPSFSIHTVDPTTLVIDVESAAVVVAKHRLSLEQLTAANLNVAPPNQSLPLTICSILASKKMVRHSALLAIFLLLLSPSTCLRLPRSFTPDHFCSACRAVSLRLSDAYLSVPADATLDSGSFRLSGSGKQAGLQKVPMRQTELHAGHVIDATCKAIGEKFVVFDVAPAVFVADTAIDGVGEKALRDTRAVRALGAFCNDLLDEYYDEIVAMIKAGPLVEEELLGEAGRLCGVTGVFKACKGGVGLSADVVEVVRGQVREEAEQKAREVREEEEKTANSSESGSGESREIESELDGGGEEVVKGVGAVVAEVESGEEL